MKTKPSETCGARSCARKFSAHCRRPASSKPPGQCAAMENSLFTILPQPCHNFLAGPNFFHRLALARDGGAFAAHQNLGGQRTRVVIGGLRKTVSTRAQDSEIIAFAGFWQRTVFAKKVAGFANRPDHVGFESRTALAPER